MNFFSPATQTGIDNPTSNPKLNDLSRKERESGIHDLHGVSDIPQENEVLVQSALKALRGELNLTESITTDDSELLKFLRAENFGVTKAAARFNRFSTLQTKLFGKHGKGRLSELKEEDAKFLQSGFMQLLPQRDRAGRAIIMCLGALKQQFKTSLESDLRCLSFLTSKAAEDEDTQKRGIVMIFYALAQKTYDGRNNRPVRLLKAFGDLPARVVATHFCYDNAAMKPLLNLLSNHMETKMLCRFRSHCGQHGDCQYNLMTFGIPKECLPIDVTGQVDLNNHKLLLESVRLQEKLLGTIGNGQSLSEMSTSVKEKLMIEGKIQSEKFLIPGYLDIILGRGQHAKNTPGHLRFKQLLDSQQARYEAAEKSQKTIVADLILKELKAAGCRFLKPRSEGGWVQVTDEAGREKINHAFRNLRSTSKKAASSSSASSSTPTMSTSSSLLSRKRVLDNVLESGRYPFQFSSDLSDKKFFPF
ncbi:MAG: hypothetical protein SGBAC_004423 [Bacillariaceae sp.]